MTPAFRTPAAVATATPVGAADMRLNAGGGGGEVVGNTRGAIVGGGRVIGRNVGIEARGGGAGGKNGASAIFTPSATTTAAGGGGAVTLGSEGGGGGAEGKTNIGHLLDLGARLGTFFPPAVGPGPVPGLDQLLQEAADVISTVEKHPPTPGYKYGGVGLASHSHTTSSGIGEGFSGGSGGSGGGSGVRFLATPGLTPIPTTRTPHVGGGGGTVLRGAFDEGEEECEGRETPSMFLAGLLRGGPGPSGRPSPPTAAMSRAATTSAADAGEDDVSMIATVAVETPTPRGGVGGGVQENIDGGGGRGAARVMRIATSSTVSGLDFSSSTTPTAAVDRGAAVGGAAREVAAGGGGGRASRAGTGSRRIGGRLSFSSAAAGDDGSGGEGGESRTGARGGAVGTPSRR